MLSTILRGCKVRVLVNDGLEPDTAEIVTLASLLDKGVFPLIHMTSVSMTATAVSVADLMKMLQVRVRGTILPANSGPRGTVTLTSGVETGTKGTRFNQLHVYMYNLWILFGSCSLLGEEMRTHKAHNLL